MRQTSSFMFGLLAVAVLALGWGVATAGDDAPAAQPKVEKTAVEAGKSGDCSSCSEKCDKSCGEKCDKGATATASPIHSILMWVGSQVTGSECACASTPEGQTAWNAWYTSKDPVLAPLRAKLMADGWTQERFIGFFKAIAAQQAEPCCGKCESGEACDSDCKCDKAKGSGTAVQTSDVPAKAAGEAAKSGDCAGCPSKCGDAAKSGDCEGCPSKPKGCCGGCDKDKAKDVPAEEPATVG